MNSIEAMAQERATVLLVEDDEFLTLDLSLTLEEAGYNVLSAATVAEALQRLTTSSVEVALLDVSLAGLERAFPVADALEAGGIPFAFMTGHSRSHLPERFKVVPIVAKPYHPEELVSVLTEITRR